MNETALRALLDQATTSEPPIGALVNNSLRAGRKLRRRRNQLVVVTAAVVGMLAAALPAAYAGLGAFGHQQQSSQVQAVRWPVAFVAAGTHIVPVRTRTGTAETPIAIPRAEAYNMAVAADGIGLVDGYTSYVVPVNLATRKAGRPIRVIAAGRIAVTPDGRTAYVSGAHTVSPDGRVSYRDAVVPIDLASNHVEKPINTGNSYAMDLTVTPNGRMLYAAGDIDAGVLAQSTEIVPIQTATNKALKPIVLDGAGAPLQLLVTPNGKTLVVLDEGPGGVGNSVTQVSIAANSAGRPVPIAIGVDAMVLAPDGKIAYVVSGRAVVPVDLATNTALPRIPFPKGSGNALNAVITPNGRRLYVYTPREIIPISTVGRKALKPIQVPGLDYPTGIAMNPNGKVLYVGAKHTLVPISTATDRLGTAIPLDGKVFAVRPWAFVFRP